MRKLLYRDTLATPIGTLTLVVEGEELIAILFEGSVIDPVGSQEPVPARSSQILEQAQSQLERYFRGERKDFDLPLLSMGTTFQQLVWREISKIPYGETKSYKEIAAALGNKNKARAVGQAANKNPLPVVIPCHRVIGSSGKLTGFAGGLDIKTYLLNLEAIKKRGCNDQKMNRS